MMFEPSAGGSRTATSGAGRRCRGVTTQQHAMEPNVIADLRVGANAHVVDSGQLDKVVVVVQHAVDVLVGVVAERVRYGGHAHQAAFRNARLEFFVATGAA